MNFIPDRTDINELDIHYCRLLKERTRIMCQMMANQNEINRTIDQIEGLAAAEIQGAV